MISYFIQIQAKLLDSLPANEIHTGLDASCDSFYSSQGRQDDNFTDHNEELIAYIKKKHPEAESLEMETFMLFHLAKCSNDAGSIKRKRSIVKEIMNTQVNNIDEGNKISLNVEMENDGGVITEIEKSRNTIRAAATMMVYFDRKTDGFIDPSRVEYLEPVAGLAVLDVLVSIKLEEEIVSSENDEDPRDLIN